MLTDRSFGNNILKNSGMLFLLMLSFVSSGYASSNLIHNGDFAVATPTPPAIGIPNWVSSTSTNESYYAPTINTSIGNPAGTGAPCAIVGGTSAYQGTSSLLQYVYVPPDALGNTLMMSYQWVADKCLQTFDWAEGRIQGVPFFHEEPAQFPQVDPTPGWRQITPFVPLGNYRNTTITVEFLTHCDTIALQTNYLCVDDVALWCTTATKTATPTISGTSTVTPTKTISPTISLTPTITFTATISVTAAITSSATQTFTPTITLTSALTSPPAATATTTKTAGTSAGFSATATATNALAGVDLDWKVALAYPNPAHTEVRFLMHLLKPAQVRIELYNGSGEHVAVLASGFSAGAGQVLTWNCRNVAPGIYLANIFIDGKSRGVLKVAVTK